MERVAAEIEGIHLGIFVSAQPCLICGQRRSGGRLRELRRSVLTKRTQLFSSGIGRGP
jgi:hypothetical protein